MMEEEGSDLYDDPQITPTKHIYLKVITICQKKTEKPLQIFFKNIWVITKYFQHLWIEAFKKDQ